MKNKISYTLALATLTSFGITFNAVATEKPLLNSVTFSSEIAQANPPQRGRGDKKGDRMMENLNLTSQQKQQMESIQAKYKPQMDSFREQIDKERQKMSQMMSSDDSENNLRSQHERIVSLDQKINNLRFESMLEMRKVLTPEQRQQFAQRMGERKGNRMQRNDQ